MKLTQQPTEFQPISQQEMEILEGIIERGKTTIPSTDFETCPIGTMRELEFAREEIERLKMLVGRYLYR